MTAIFGLMRIPFTILFCMIFPALVTCAEDNTAPTGTVRFAVFNAALNRPSSGHLLRDLKNGRNRQLKGVAEIVQRVRPDVLVLQEFDYDPAGESADLFCENFLGKSQRKHEPIEYPYSYCGPVNTGLDTGLDLDNDGQVSGPADCHGYGAFPGQYGMLVLSRYPLEEESIRTFRGFLWKDMPEALLPVDPETGDPFYTEAERKVLRLSSKSHWDVPVQIDAQTVHLLICHPSPPVFDGPEDRNGRRNHDEIRFWADYISSGRNDYIYDDRGNRGGLETGAAFILMGDLNADPIDGESVKGTIQQILDHPLVNATATPVSIGATEQAGWDSALDRNQAGDPAADTASFHGGNLRADYALPSRNLTITASGVFWPGINEDGYDLLKVSDHRLVWVDVQIAGR